VHSKTAPRCVQIDLEHVSTVYYPFIASNPCHHHLHHSISSIHASMCSRRLTIRFSAEYWVWLCSPDLPGLSQACASVLGAPYTLESGCLLALTTQCHSILHSRVVYNTPTVVKCRKSDRCHYIVATAVCTTSICFALVFQSVCTTKYIF
jgi:hypothetical protein